MSVAKATGAPSSSWSRLATGAREYLASGAPLGRPRWAHTTTREPADRAVELEAMTLYVEEGLEGLVDIEEPHDRLVLRPAGSTPNSREH